MKHILTSFYAKPLGIYLVASRVFVTAFASPAAAMFIPAAPGSPALGPSGRSADLAAIQRTLETRQLEQRLMDYGLSSQKAMEKIQGLSDDQVHQLSARIAALQAGGRGEIDNQTGLLIAILVVLVLILLIVNATDMDAARA